MLGTHVDRTLCAGLIAALSSIPSCQPQQAQDALSAREFVAPPLTARDASGQGNDGVNVGALEVGLPGRFGTAYSFREPGSWILVAPAPELNPGTDSFLVYAWAKIPEPPAPGQSMDVIRKGLHGSPGGELKLEIVAGGLVKCTVKDAAGRGASKFGPVGNVADGTWHRIGCARTSGRLTAISDGRLASKRVATGAIRNTLPLAIGSKYGQEDSPGGRLDEVGYHVAPPVLDDQGRPLPLRRQLEHLEKASNAVGLWHLDEKSPTVSP